MADRYIDHDETKIYGDYAAKMIRKLVVVLVPAFDAGMEHLASEITDATEAVRVAVAEAWGASARVRGLQRMSGAGHALLHARLAFDALAGDSRGRWRA